jgi:hypothetical protein
VAVIDGVILDESGELIIQIKSTLVSDSGVTFERLELV